MIDTSVISVGIDVGKSKLDVSCMRQDKSVTHQVFSNTKKGIAEVVRLLKKQKTASTIPCVLESTGDCHLLPALLLRDAGFTVKCINPIITKKYTNSSIRAAKSDSVDSAMLARIGLNEPELNSFIDTRETIAAKKLISSLAQLETVRQKIAAHLQHLKETSNALGIRYAAREAQKALDHIEKQIELFRLQVAAAAPSEAQTIAAMLPGVSHQQVSVLLVARAAVSGPALATATWREWAQFWTDLADFVRVLNEHTIGRPFEIDAGNVHGDGDMLFKALKQSQYFETLLRSDDTAVTAACVKVASSD
jgi:transposase